MIKMLLKISILVVLVLSITLPVFAQSTSTEITLSSSKKTYSVKVGDSICIKLDENVTTGYSWHYTMNNTIFKNTYNKSIAASSNLVGAGSKHVWKFKAQKKGCTILTFNYYRTWEGKKSSVKTVCYKVKII